MRLRQPQKPALSLWRYPRKRSHLHGLDANAQSPNGEYPFFTCGDETLRINHYAFDTEAVLLAGNGNFNVKWYHGKFNAYQRTYVIESRGIRGKFLFYLMQNLLKDITKGNRGSTIRFIRIGDIQNCEAAVAPLQEQDRIVDEIEKQFTRLDAATAALKRVRANLKRYRASVLKAACEGRLVPTEAQLALKEGRDYEPADQLFQRILRERRARWEADTLANMIASGKPPKDDRWKQKYKEPATPDTSQLPPLPEGWVWASLDQISVLIRNGISTKPEGESGIPILRISAVRPLQVDSTDVRFLSDLEDWRAYELNSGDLLFTRYNGSRDFVGVCGMVRNLQPRTVHPDKLIRVVLSYSELAPFVEIVSNSGWSRSFLERRIRTTAGQSGISGEDLKSLPIPLCPGAEQKRIALEVDRRLTTVCATEGEILTSFVRAARLRRSILEKAFSGTLVPQDPNEEPASVLLKRIRAERQKSAVPSQEVVEQHAEVSHV